MNFLWLVMAGIRIKTGRTGRHMSLRFDRLSRIGVTIFTTAPRHPLRTTRTRLNPSAIGIDGKAFNFRLEPTSPLARRRGSSNSLGSILNRGKR